MRKLIAVAFLVLTLLAGAIGVIHAQGAATPPSQDGSSGASVDIVAETMSSDGAVGMTLYRITLAPGTEVLDHEHFGTLTWYIASGEVTVTITEGEAWVRCADACVPGAEPSTDGSVLVPLGQEVVLKPGDWFFQHGRTVHAYTSTGDTDAVIEASTTYPLPAETGSPAPEQTPAASASPAAGGPTRIMPQGCRGGCL